MKKMTRALIQFPWPERDPLPALELAAIAAGSNPGQVHLNHSLETGEGYAYIQLADDAPNPTEEIRKVLANRLAAAQVRRLSRLLSIDGAASGQPALYHYVVETDVLPEWEKELNDWYDTEHLAGLASVPGSINANRFCSLEGGPKYLACYDLERLDVFNSPAWLAVRGTDWSSRVRPAFRNTKRTMFRRVA